MCDEPAPRYSTRVRLCPIWTRVSYLGIKIKILVVAMSIDGVSYRLEWLTKCLLLTSMRLTVSKTGKKTITYELSAEWVLSGLHFRGADCNQGFYDNCFLSATMGRPIQVIWTKVIQTTAEVSDATLLRTFLTTGCLSLIGPKIGPCFHRGFTLPSFAAASAML